MKRIVTLVVVLACAVAIGGVVFDPFLGKLRSDEAGSVVAGSSLATSISGVLPTAPGNAYVVYRTGGAWSTKAESTLAVDLTSITGLSDALSAKATTTTTDALLSRIQVQERNNLFLAIQTAISSNLAAQVGYETRWDQFEDEAAVQTKTGAYYNATDDYYSSRTPGTVDVLVEGTASGTATDFANAVDDNNATFAAGSGWPLTIVYDVGAGNEKIPSGYTIRGYTDAAHSPDEWVFAASNDNSNWTTLDSQTGVSWPAPPQVLTYTVTGITTAYRYFRLTIAGVVGNSGEGLGLTEWQVFAPTTSDVTLVSTYQDLVTTPINGSVFLLLDDVEAVTANTDFKAYITRDGGTTWVQVTLAMADDITPLAGYHVFIGDVDFSGPTGISGGIKFTTHNTKSLNLKAWAFQVRP